MVGQCAMSGCRSVVERASEAGASNTNTLPSPTPTRSPVIINSAQRHHDSGAVCAALSQYTPGTGSLNPSSTSTRDVGRVDGAV